MNTARMYVWPQTELLHLCIRIPIYKITLERSIILHIRYTIVILCILSARRKELIMSVSQLVNWLSFSMFCRVNISPPTYVHHSLRQYF